MIHVQIARDITTTGVEGVRWVLLDAPDLPAPGPTALAPDEAPIAVQALVPAGGGLRRKAWQLAIAGLGLVAVIGLAQQQMSQASPSRPAPAAAPALRPAVPQAAAWPASAAALPAPPASAANLESRITAGL